MSSVTLNHDIFLLVLDEVLGRLNLYRTKEWIDLAYILRRVNHCADDRLTTISRRYLDIPSADALQRLIRSGVPNHPVHESLTLSFYPSQSLRDWTTLTRLHSMYGTLRKVVFDLRLADLDTSRRTLDSWRGLSGTVEALGIIEKSQPRYWDYALRRSARLFLQNSSRSLRFATCDPSDLSSLELNTWNSHTITILLQSPGFASGVGELLKLGRLEGPVMRPNTIRLAFGEDLSRSEILGLKLSAQPTATDPAFIFEELAVDPHYERAIDWFADRIQDGTIWTMPGRPITLDDDGA
ncbi:hypothetical protein CALVIDRAFT_602051 [Calocera viscosa TUFC12733]|uniref:Uncharacterized protein n=1 Tax=Calocera viscosa (strain TUFC12733) TaxID=1330018 RepID=A0A167HJ97_CALVF|nr:hypothetical protein CALVIDRAFT_602051 [Calocera viscosa TUFC12733]